MKDIMARIALNEPMTDSEQNIYASVMNLSTDGPNYDGLFMLLQAINRKATLRGLKLGITLRRPPQKKKRLPKVMSYAEIDKLMPQLPVGKKLTGRSFIRPETAPFLMERGRKVGRIETMLRGGLPWSGLRAHHVYKCARASLRRQGIKSPDDIDIMSEAIEAAAALGL